MDSNENETERLDGRSNQCNNDVRIASCMI